MRELLAAFGDSVLASQAYAAPVPQSVPEFYPLMILAGTLTAVLVDFLAVGLRRAPLAGLPLLAVYTAPVSVLDGGVSWLKFAAAALCFLFLIASEEAQRLSHWGHQLVPGGRIFDTQTTTVSGQADLGLGAQDRPDRDRRWPSSSRCWCRRSAPRCSAAATGRATATATRSRSPTR